MTNLDNIEKGLGWLDKILSIIEKYRIKTILKGVLVILIIAATVGFIGNPTWIFEQYEAWKDKEHAERLNIRMRNNEKLHILAEKLMYKVDADRVMVLELHNGLENAVGLPFSKCTATYEALNTDVYPIANQYQGVNLSLMPFANYLFQNGYWCGDVDELEKIDRGLFHKIKGNGTEHIACCLVEGVDEPLAFIFVSFAEIPNHDCDDVRQNLRHIALETALLLELNK